MADFKKYYNPKKYTWEIHEYNEESDEWEEYTTNIADENTADDLLDRIIKVNNTEQNFDGKNKILPTDNITDEDDFF